MHISQKGIDLVKRFEGCVLSAYKCPAGVWTIGYGHTGSVHEGMKVSPSEAEQLLRDDLMLFEEGVAKSAPVCTQGQFDALVSFAFNLGLGALRSSTLLKLHKNHDYAGAAEQFGRWIYANGHRQLPGLVARRAAEAELYRGE